MSIGVDLDGTLARYDGWMPAEHIGEPLEPMASQVRQWLDQGIAVDIITARVETESQSRDAAKKERASIRSWLSHHGLDGVRRISNGKLYDTEVIYDDRAIRVRRNTGMPCLLCDPQFGRGLRLVQGDVVAAEATD